MGKLLTALVIPVPLSISNNRLVVASIVPLPPAFQMLTP